MSNNVIFSENTARKVEKSVLVSALVENNRFRSRKLSKEQVGSLALSNWVRLVSAFHEECYKVAEKAENADISVENLENADFNGCFDTLRPIFDIINNDDGETTLKMSKDFVLSCIMYASRRVNENSVELDKVLTDIRETRKVYKNAVESGLDESIIDSCETKLEELESKKVELLNTADNSTKIVTMSTSSAFRGEFERRIARYYVEKRAETVESINEKKKSRRNKARKNAKAAKKAEKVETAC